MEIDPTEVAKVVNRLKRTQGQVGGIARMLEEGRAYEDVITQLAAASRALDRAGFALTACALKRCLSEPGSEESAQMLMVEEVFPSLA